MRLSLWLFFTNLLPSSRSFVEKHVIDRLSSSTNAIFTQKPLDTILSTFKNAGIDGIELSMPTTVTDSQLLEVKQLLLRQKLPVLSIHQPLRNVFELSLQTAESLCKIANFYNCKVVVLHSDSIGSDFLNKHYISQLKRLEKKYSISFCIENMPYSPFSFFKRYTWEQHEFSKRMKELDLCITFDTTHLGQVNGDMLQFYEDNKKRINNIHLSDYKKHFINRYLLMTGYTHLPFGKGRLPIKELLSRLKKDKYKGLITLEINSSLKELIGSIEKVRKLI
jgi:sugar phosphate isomerase/epimerase